MKQLKALTTQQIKKWGLSISQLKAYLQQELQRSIELQTSLKEAQIELSKIQELSLNARTNTLIGLSNLNDMDMDNIAAAIVQARQKNIAIQGQIGHIKNQIKETKKKHIKGTGSSKHDKYTRIMSNLTSRKADIRNTWDSEDVLEIEDYAMENAVSYDEAADALETKMKSFKGEQLSDEE